MDITEFVKARLDEDEWIAQGAARTDDGRDGRWLPAHFGADGFDARVDDHIAHHDPARVLLEVAAKRAILALADTGEGYAYSVAMECVVVQLAAVYSDHLDYRVEWRP